MPSPLGGGMQFNVIREDEPSQAGNLRATSGLCSLFTATSGPLLSEATSGRTCPFMFEKLHVGSSLQNRQVVGERLSTSHSLLLL